MVYYINSGYLDDLAKQLRRLSIPTQVTEDAADELERISKIIKPMTTEQLDKAQFGCVLHKRPRVVER